MKYLHITDGSDWMLTEGPDHWVQRIPPLLSELGFECERAVVVAEKVSKMSDLARQVAALDLPRDFDFVSLHAGVFDLVTPRTEAERASDFEALLDTACEFAGGRPGRVLLIELSALDGLVDELAGDSGDTAGIGELVALERELTMLRWQPHIFFTNDELHDFLYGPDGSEDRPLDIPGFVAYCATHVAGIAAHAVSHPPAPIPTEAELAELEERHGGGASPN
jgi:hypothetical protein